MQPIVPPSPSSPLTHMLGQLNEAIRRLPADAEHSAPARLRREVMALAEVIHRDGEGPGAAHTAEANSLLRRIQGYLAATAEPSAKP
jgi:hypothetical protein